MLRFELLPQSVSGGPAEAGARRGHERRGLEMFHVPLLFSLGGQPRGVSFDELAARSLIEAQEEHRPQPASREAVESLNVREASRDDDDACAVCLDALCEGAARLMDMPCGHTLHERCLRQWLRENNQCPTCRSELPSTPSSAPSARHARPAASFGAPPQDTALVLAVPPRRVRRARPQARRREHGSGAGESNALPMLPHEVLQFSQRLHELAGLDRGDPPAVPITASALVRVPAQPAQPARSRRGRSRPPVSTSTTSPVQPPPRVPSDQELVDSAVDELLAA